MLYAYILLQSKYKMKDETIKYLENLKNGKSFTLTKDSPKEIKELIKKLTNLGVLHKTTRYKYTSNFKNRKYLAKLIELKSWVMFLNWLDKQNTDSSIVNDFSGSTIGQVNQSSKQKDLKSSITKRIEHKATKEHKKFWLQITVWIIGIIASLLAIYEFLIKNL